MSWKRAVNRALVRTIGYELRRAGDGDSRTDARPSEPRSGAPVVKAGQQKADTRPKRQFPGDYDGAAKDIIRTVRPYTMTSRERLNALILATRYVSQHDIQGDIVECGVWRGGSMHAVVHTLLALNDTERELYLFDTYEGMPPPSEKDLRRDGASAVQLLNKKSKDSPIWAVATLEDVQEGFRGLSYPTEKVHFVKGLVEETVPAQAPERISILRLDTDWYESTRHELEHLYPRLVSGGVLLIDDYGWWQGSRQAVDEFLKETGERLLLLRMDDGRIAVKP